TTSASEGVVSVTTDMNFLLGRLAQRLYGADARVSDLSRLTSGATLETWAFTVRTSNATHENILRRRMSPTEFAISLKSEAALLQAVAKRQVRAPPLIHLCDARDELGEAHVTRRVLGETLGRKIVADPRFDSVRSHLAYQCGEQLARIHSTPAPTALE